ncbi:MAG: MBL fold metallo-hydrolase [Phycisphaerales bacterium]|nr:MBL fold metallo-hydrolase [Phycisphaerales bacterium]
MVPECRIVSIGALAAHNLWNESSPVRAGHMTTSLVEADGLRMIVDPSLPPESLLPRLAERSSCSPNAVSHVFLTSLIPETMRGLEAFPEADWLAFETELLAARSAANSALEHESQHPEDGGAEHLQRLLAKLDRIQPAEDALARGVDLFPLPGVTIGTCGILLAQPRRTLLIAGDAVPTAEHLAEAQVLPNCVDHERAQESFKEAIEIADVIIPGRDNLLLNS